MMMMMCHRSTINPELMTNLTQGNVVDDCSSPAAASSASHADAYSAEASPLAGPTKGVKRPPAAPGRKVGGSDGASRTVLSQVSL